jgi:hypothetical protein
MLMWIGRISPGLNRYNRPRDYPLRETRAEELFYGIPSTQAELP